MELKKHILLTGKATLDVFYPNNCQICSHELLVNEQHICLSCLYDLPYLKNNPHEIERLKALFWGRVPVNELTSLLLYKRGNQTQNILQLLKYNGRQKLGYFLGRQLGDLTKNWGCDLVVPIPLHPKKMRKRGYNQSEVIAEGMVNSMQADIAVDLIRRKSYSESQTTFAKFDRWDNVKNIFQVKHPDRWKGKHLLVVDDVLTTGATIESCIKELLKIPEVNISVATLAARL